jgi:hypothetical protein
VVGVVDDTVEFEIEQFAEAQTGAEQDLDGAASGGVVELVDAGHEVAVAVGAQRSRDGFGEAWQVAAMDKRPGRLLRPSPQARSSKNALSVDTAWCWRAIDIGRPRGPSDSRRAAVVPDEEPLDHRPAQLLEASDRRVMVGERDREQVQAAAAVFDG